MRLGLCCQFAEEPISFTTTTAKHLSTLDSDAVATKLAGVVQHNAATLMRALEACTRRGIRAFRIQSGLWPLATHPQFSYRPADLPDGDALVEAYRACGVYARERGIRLSFHPDQFTLLNSPRPEVLASSLRDLEYMADMCDLLGADVVNIHGGGVYGDRTSALDRLEREIERLPDRVRRLLTLENDDVSFPPEDLLPICERTGLPMVYDVHHHRCLPDSLSIETATERALATWNREPHFHVSSPDGTDSRVAMRKHAPYINPDDLPKRWLELDLTVDVEARAKELAVVALGRALGTGIEEKGLGRRESIGR